MALNWPAKDPDEVLDYTWTPALSAGDTIASIAATRVAGGVTLDATANTSASVTLTLSGGTAGQISAFQIRATTDAGYVLEETLYITCVASANAAVADFKRRYPAFAVVANETIETYLADAASDVGDMAEDTDRATYLHAAHYMTLNGIGAGSEAQTAGLGAKRLKSGTFEIELGAAADMQGLGSTNYGRQFLALLKRYRGAMVTGTGTWPVRRSVAPWGY